MIYLDYAATSWPKPPQVIRAMADYLENSGGNPGRSGHRLSVAAGRVIFNTRLALAELFNIPDPMRVIFTPNVTYALNLVLNGLLWPGDRVVTTSMEHNSVMRPLRALQQRGIELAVAACSDDGSLSLETMAAAITPGTRLVVVTHASNIVGAVLPIESIADLAHRTGALILVDAAQTAGILPIDVTAAGIDFLAFTGHKGLHGPQGTGGLVIGAGVELSGLEPLIRGGTGSRSEFEEQPDLLPDKYESGTANGVGIAGLGAGVRWISERSVESIRTHESALTRALIEGLSNLHGVRLYGPCDPQRMTSVVSCTFAGIPVSEVGLRLEDEHQVLCRVGLHCAPSAHRTIGTFPTGTVRLAPGLATTLDDIRKVIAAAGRITVTERTAGAHE